MMSIVYSSDGSKRHEPVGDVFGSLRVGLRPRGSRHGASRSWDVRS